jgi:type II secretory pathway component PulC
MYLNMIIIIISLVQILTNYILFIKSKNKNKIQIYYKEFASSYRKQKEHNTILLIFL